VLDEKAY